MKRLVIFTAISISIAGLMGCAGTAERSNTGENKNTAAVATTAENKNVAAKTALKPADINADKAVTVKDLVDAINASPDGWTGKQVTVTAYVSATSESGPKNTLLTLTNDRADTGIKGSCNVQGSYDEVSEKVFDKTVEVKGTIRHIQGADAETRRVGLEPCEVKK